MNDAEFFKIRPRVLWTKTLDDYKQKCLAYALPRQPTPQEALDQLNKPLVLRQRNQDYRKIVPWSEKESMKRLEEMIM